MKKSLIFIVLAVGILCGCQSLQGKYSKTTTPQLQLRHEQLVEYLNSEKKSFEFHFGNPMFQSDPRKDRIEEKEDIETELLRRYQAGDKTAYLPMFPQN
jgi:hypothetical protein